VNADPEFYPDIGRDFGILGGDATLDFRRATSRVNGTGELDQHAVARGLDDPASMGGDGGINESLSDSLKTSQRTFFVGAHKAAIPGDVSRQHRCQSPFCTLARQGMPLDW
jgi:hypothetical protein